MYKYSCVYIRRGGFAVVIVLRFYLVNILILCTFVLKNNRLRVLFCSDVLIDAFMFNEFG